MSANLHPPSCPSPAIKTPASAEAATGEGHSHRTLPATLRRDGFDYRQIAREDSAAIYEQCKGGAVLAYEVIRIGRHDGFTVAGRSLEPAETYPTSQAWGRDAWTLPTREAAFHKLRLISD